ncbi:MAG: SGNH/GDSL hydrolase family protein [Pseudomonadota bacterium]
MKKTALAASLLVGLTGIASAAPVEPFTGLVVFGDSLSDDGKAGSLAPPSFGGRWSNGPVWAEYLANSFRAVGAASGNYAIGGATAGDVNTTAYPPSAQPLATFDGQVGAFSASGLSNFLGDNPLVTVLFGANDVFQNLGAPGFDPVDVANDVADGIRAVSQLGGKFDDFLLINLPDLTLTPAFGEAARLAAEATGDPVVIGTQAAISAAAQRATIDFNNQLAILANDLRTIDGLNIIEFDQDAYLRDVIADPSPLGITDTIFPCSLSLGSFDPTANCAVLPDGSIDPTLANTKVFVDSVHPTAPVHEYFAASISAALGDALPTPTTVPVPAGLPLLLAGLLSFAWLRRTQAA